MKDEDILRKRLATIYIDECISIVERHKQDSIVVETILRELKEYKNRVKKS